MGRWWKIFVICGVFVLAVSVADTTVASHNPPEGLVVCTGVTGAHPCTTCDFFALIDKIVRFITVTLIPPLAVILVAIGGFLYLTAGGSEQRLTKGKDVLVWTILGAVLAYASFLILHLFLVVLAGEKVTLEKFFVTSSGFSIQCQVLPPAPPPPPSALPAVVSGCPTCTTVVGGVEVQVSCNRNEARGGTTCPISSQVQASYDQTIASLNNRQTDIDTCISSVDTNCFTFYVTDTIDDPGSHSGTCHKPNEVDSGTCFDVSVNIFDSRCFGVTKASDCLNVAPAVAAEYLDKIKLHLNNLQTSGAVVSYIDEYRNPQQSTKGGHFHIVLKGS